MIDCFFYWFLILMIEYVFIFYAVKRTEVLFLYVLIQVNMMMITLFGVKLISLFGYLSDIGNVFYSSVMVSQLILLKQYGAKAANRTISIILMYMGYFLLLLFTLGMFPTIPGNEEISIAIQTLSQTAQRIVMVSLIGYSFGQFVLIQTYEYLRKKTSDFNTYMGSWIASQIVSSCIFFPLVFAGSPFVGIISITAVSILFKSLIGVVFFPLYAMADKKV